MSTPYRERLAALHERIRVALDPQTDQELLIVEWLGNWDIPTLEPLAAMTERAAEGGRRAVAMAYERGYHEGALYACQHGGTATVCQPCKDNRCEACERPRGQRLAADGQLRPTCCCGRRFV
jgi:hypothetical protein